MTKNIPVTVITGSLGAGKTTLIRSMVRQLPTEYKSVWLKNEYGDINIDSEVAKASNIQTKEVLNGCLCCVLVGKLHEALEEIVDENNPDRIIIETAGTAYPFPVIMQINRTDNLKLDGLITVIDAKNFEAFRDNSVMAKEQAKYVDLVVINKVSMVNEKQLEKAMDYCFEQYPGVPKVKTADGTLPLDSLIGIDSKFIDLYAKGDSIEETHNHENEHTDNVESFGFVSGEGIAFTQKQIIEFIQAIKTWGFIRIKGIVNTSESSLLLNVVGEDITFEKIPSYVGPTKITFMGKDTNRLKDRVLSTLKKLSDSKVS